MADERITYDSEGVIKLRSGEQPQERRNLAVDQSGEVTPEALALMKKAGGLVGLNISEPSALLNPDGTVSQMASGNVAYRIQTNDLDLWDKFTQKLEELEARQS